MAILKPKKYKIARRLGAGVFEKTQSQKFLLSQARRARKGSAPKRVSDYGKQLIEKQKVRYSYNLLEKQFRNYVDQATENAGNLSPALGLFQILESRLDNVMYRLGIAPTRGAARQMVSHGHVVVNGKRTTVPSYRVKNNDVISIRKGSQSSPLFLEIEKKLKNAQHPQWLRWDNTKMEARVNGVAHDPDPFLDFQSVIEYYSR